MSNYQNGKIYKIASHQTDDIYIGSTCQKKLSMRFNEHKSNYNKWLNGIHHSISSFDILKHDDAYIELIENFPCESKKELFRREGELQKELKCVNRLIAGRTRNEHRYDNKDKINKQCRDYYNNNDGVRNKIVNKTADYRAKHKDEIKEKRKTKYTCICGAYVLYDHKARHEKTKKHINYKDVDLAKIDDPNKYVCECKTVVVLKSKDRHLRSKKHQEYIANNN